MSTNNYGNNTCLISHYSGEAKQNTNRFLTIDDLGEVTGCSPTSEPDQEWLVCRSPLPGQSTLCTIQNVGNGLYLSATSTDGVASGKSPVNGKLLPYSWKFVQCASSYKVQIPKEPFYVGISNCVDPPEGIQIILGDQNEKVEALRWAFIPVPTVYPIAGGTYVLRCLATNTAVASGTSLKAVDERVVGWKPNSGANQKWKITIKPGSGHYLLANNNGMMLGCAVALAPAVSCTLQKTPTCFRIIPLGNDLYSFRVPSTNYMLDVSACNPANGTKVIFNPSHGGPNQKFFLDRC